MATQPCAPAQGRSSSSEPSSMLHIGCTEGERRRERESRREGGKDRQKEREQKNYFKVTNQKHFSDAVVGEQTRPCLHLVSDTHLHARTHTVTFLNKETNKKEAPGLGACRFFCQLIKYLAGQCKRERQREGGTVAGEEESSRAWLCVFLSLMVHCCEATWGFSHLLSSLTFSPLPSEGCSSIPWGGSAACLQALTRLGAAHSVH